MADPFWDAVLSRIDLSNPLVLFVVLLLLAYGAISKRLAQIKGPLGALARWWNGRQVARVKREQAIWEQRHKSDRAREIAEHKADRARDGVELEQLRLDVDWLRRELDDMRQRERLQNAQARKHTTWDLQLVQRAQSAGIEIPEPPPLYVDLAALYIPDQTGA